MDAIFIKILFYIVKLFKWMLDVWSGNGEWSGVGDFYIKFFIKLSLFITSNSLSG